MPRSRHAARKVNADEMLRTEILDELQVGFGFWIDDTTATDLTIAVLKSSFHGKEVRRVSRSEPASAKRQYGGNKSNGGNKSVN